MCDETDSESKLIKYRSIFILFKKVALWYSLLCDLCM